MDKLTEAIRTIKPGQRRLADGFIVECLAPGHTRVYKAVGLRTSVTF